MSTIVMMRLFDSAEIIIIKPRYFECVYTLVLKKNQNQKVASLPNVTKVVKPEFLLKSCRCGNVEITKIY